VSEIGGSPPLYRGQGAVNSAPMQRLVVLISGGGSNMLALAQACQQERWPAEIVGVISNRASAGGLSKAADLGLATHLLATHPDESRQEYDRRLAELIHRLTPDWILLAGFMRILSAEFVAQFTGKMINIHPSLLPSFPGLHTHRRALEAKVPRHGVTVHFVIPELDAGPVIAQAGLNVLPEDTEESLAARVLKLEHQLYPEAVRQVLAGHVRFTP
jgi:phosphoribosylglycinamide formyltransferase 1